MQNKGKNNHVIVFISSQVEVEGNYDLERHLKDFWGVGNVIFLYLSGTYIDTCFITNCSLVCVCLKHFPVYMLYSIVLFKKLSVVLC